MRIVMITSDYSPLRSSCAIQMRDLAQELSHSGHEPIVIVPSQGLHEGSTNELIDGVQVLRIASLRTKEISYFRRTIGEILLPFTILYGLRKFKLSIADLDAIVWYSPSIFFGLLVWFLKRYKKCKTYLILRDIFPEWMLDLGLMTRGPAYYLFKLFAKFQYSVADTIGVQTPSNLVYLSEWVQKKPARRLEVLQNWLSVAPLAGSSISIDQTHLAGRKIFVYIGNMGVAQGMDILIDLAQEFRQRTEIGFLFVGRGTEVDRLRSRVVELKLDNIHFSDEVDSKEMPGLLSTCEVGLIALDPRHRSHNIPGKFLTYMQAGLPVLARVNAGTDLIKLIEQEGVGVVYVGSDVLEFRRMAEELIDNTAEMQTMSEHGRALSYDKFSSAIAASQIVSALSDHNEYWK